MTDEPEGDPDHDSDPDHDPELEAMADALGQEGEGEEDAGLLGRGPGLPKTLILPALTLVAASAAPLHPDGYSFLQILYAAFLRHPLEGLVTLLGFGAPFCFGVIVALGAYFADRSPGARQILRRFSVANLSLLHAQLLLVAFILVRSGGAMMSLALLGFALVSGFYFIVQHAQAAAAGGSVDDEGRIDDSHAGPGLAFMFRWGATMIVAICGWIRLQLLVGVRLGWAVEVVLASCMAITVLLVRERPR